MLNKIRLSSNRSLIAGSSQARHADAPWLVYLPESGANFYTGSRAELTRLIGPGLSPKFNYLAINKPGLGPRSRDMGLFEASFRREHRVADALTALHTLLPTNAKIYLVGYSEGAYIAPEIARADQRVVALALIGGGTRGWLHEELNRPAPTPKRQAIRREIAKILENPRSTNKWQGFSYATWASFNADRTLNALQKLDVPVLSILGGRDRIIDLPTTLADLRKLARTKPVQVELLKNCGHSFTGHWADVGHLLKEFLNPGAGNPDLSPSDL